MLTPSLAQLNDEFEPALWPRFEAIDLNHMTATFKLSVHSELSYFAGHFPEQAVLPGVVQVHWASKLAQRFFSCEGFAELKKIKFHSMVLPITNIELCLVCQADRHKVEFVFSDDQQRLSSGILLFKRKQ